MREMIHKSSSRGPHMGGVGVEEDLGVGQGGGSQTDPGNTQDMIDALTVTSPLEDTENSDDGDGDEVDHDALELLDLTIPIETHLSLQHAAQVPLRELWVQGTKVQFLCDSGADRTMLRDRIPGVGSSKDKIMVRSANGRDLMTKLKISIVPTSRGMVAMSIQSVEDTFVAEGLEVYYYWSLDLPNPDLAETGKHLLSMAMEDLESSVRADKLDPDQNHVTLRYKKTPGSDVEYDKRINKLGPQKVTLSHLVKFRQKHEVDLFLHPHPFSVSVQKRSTDSSEEFCIHPPSDMTWTPPVQSVNSSSTPPSEVILPPPVQSVNSSSTPPSEVILPPPVQSVNSSSTPPSEVILTPPVQSVDIPSTPPSDVIFTPPVQSVDIPSTPPSEVILTPPVQSVDIPSTPPSEVILPPPVQSVNSSSTPPSEVILPPPVQSVGITFKTTPTHRLQLLETELRPAPKPRPKVEVEPNPAWFSPGRATSGSSSSSQAMFPFPDKCCFKFITIAVSMKRIRSYYWTDERCPTPAVIFVTQRSNRICVDPVHDWVQSIMNDLDKKNI
ncbi:uncharacterized protein LOC113157825 [Anabas testudineus]|uniref:uncharacterized protein LOC113157825 n=1 Tax=Anabas testudineus TaxID=64144 RepID=UPI000E464F15|nr:uncharacterized protein LOC113157825 [Anabas testudineus]